MACKDTKKNGHTQENQQKMHFLIFFLPENLVISKKSSTFALAFEKRGTLVEIDE